MARALKEAGGRHEAAAIAAIKDLGLTVVEVDRDLPRDLRQSRTVDAMLRADVDVIIHPSFGDVAEGLIATALGVTTPAPTRVSEPDVLWRVDYARRDAARDDNPLAGWVPVDIKSHGHTDENKASSIQIHDLTGDGAVVDAVARLRADDAMQLAHYVSHLTSMGLANPGNMAGIIGRDLTSMAWGSLDAQMFGRGRSAESAMQRYAVMFAESARVVDQAVLREADATVPAPAMPLWDNGGKRCPTCEYRDACLPELVAFGGTGHVTLLAGITPRDMSTVAADSIGALRDAPAATAEQRQRAQVYLNGQAQVLGGGALDVPTYDIEIDIDLENSQAVLQELDIDEELGPDRVFLYGFIKHDRTLGVEWTECIPKSFENYGGDDAAELDVLARMWSYIEAEIAAAAKANKSLAFFHYSPHEVTWFRRFADRFAGQPGVPTRARIDEVVAGFFVDLLPVARQVAFPPTAKSPVCGYSIKTLAPHVPFEWRVDDAGGGMALVRYIEATGPDPTVALAAREWLRTYNWDDVRATMALRNWLRARFG